MDQSKKLANFATLGDLRENKGAYITG
jgi:hypothetical protein